MLAVLQKAVEHRLMLPLIIGATEHEAVLYPDTHTSEVEACVNECLSEREPFGIRMETVSGSAFFEVVSHVLKSCQQELVKFLALERVVLDRKAVRGFERYAVGRIGQDEVCFFAAHELFHIFRRGGVATHDSMPADCPDVAGLHKRSHLKGSGEVKVIIVDVLFIPGAEQLIQFTGIKAEER